VLDDLIAELLVLQDALRDTTIVVPDDQIARAVQRQIDQDQQQLGGAVQLENENCAPAAARWPTTAPRSPHSTASARSSGSIRRRWRSRAVHRA
jgi:hypothetical protein